MPVNKNALIRMKLLDEILSDSVNCYSWKDIEHKMTERMEDLGFEPVTRRCLEKDIESMQSEPFNAVIIRYSFEGKTCLRYADPSFSIFTRGLTEQEKSLLTEVLNTLGQFDGLDNFEWLHCFQQGLNLKIHPKIISFSKKLETEEFQPARHPIRSHCPKDRHQTHLSQV